MQVDALTLAALADEFERELRGARVDDVIQPTPHAVALQLWGGGRNRWLMISTHPQLARIHLTDAKPRKLSAEPPAFVMLLRKYLEGARIAAIRQPRWERVIELGFGRGAEAAEGVAATWLIVEVMGRYSNATLTDANAIILGALRPVSAEVNGYRALLPHVAYRYPPPQTRTLHGATLPRLDGADVTASMLSEAALDTLASRDAPPLAQPMPGEEAGKPAKSLKQSKAKREAPTLAGLLAAQISGFSRELGREVAARSLGAPDAPLRSDFTQEQWSEIARETRALAALPTTHDWRPTLVYAPAALRDGQPTGTPFAFAAFQPQQYAPEMLLESAASMNATLDTYFQDAEWQNALEGAKGDLRHILQTQRDRCLRKAEALKGELAALDEAQRLRTEADILLTYQTEIAPGSRSFTIADPFGLGEADQQPITISLDPQLTPVENANRRYARYHKLQRAGEQIPPQLEANEIELARIEQLQADLALAETPAEVSLARAEIAEAGYIRGGAEARRLAKEQRKGGKKNKQGKGSKPGKPGGASTRAPEGGAPLRRRLAGGMIALVGKNSRQNEAVTFHEAAPNDLWLHARGVPGAHVILKTGGRPAPQEALNAAAALAAYYSQARLAGSVPVDYTEQRYVRHMKGGGPGMVIYERERTLHSAPEDAGEPVK